MSFIDRFTKLFQVSNPDDVVTPSETVTFAAKWWAQYLPGVRKIEFNEINQFSKIEDKKAKATLHTLYEIQKDSDKAVTQEQYDLFVEILTKKLLVNNYPMQLGHASSYHPPVEVSKAFEEAGIKSSPFGLFPFKTEMKIYEHNVAMNYKTIFADSTIHFLKTVADLEPFQLSNSPQVKIQANHNFRILKVDLGMGDMYQAKSVYGENKITITKMEPISWESEKVNSFYVEIDARYINGGNNKLCNLSDDELTAILRDPRELEEFIDSAYSTWVYMDVSADEESLLREDRFISKAKIHPEKLNDSCYHMSTNSVNLMKLPDICSTKKCAIEELGGKLYLLNPNDSLLANADGSLNYYITNDSYSAYLCANEDCSAVTSQPLVLLPTANAGEL